MLLAFHGMQEGVVFMVSLGHLGLSENVVVCQKRKVKGQLSTHFRACWFLLSFRYPLVTLDHGL
jgi:hypothetical protein